MCPDLIHDRHSYYFRTDPLFATAAAKYDWIDRVIGFGHGQADGSIYGIFETVAEREYPKRHTLQDSFEIPPV
jgi:hypothetical protein